MILLIMPAKRLLAAFLTIRVWPLPGSVNRNMLPNRMVILIIAAVAAASAGGVFTFVIGLPGSPCSGIVGASRNITIIATPNGYNDSATHVGNWPVMNVNRCDTVNITIINKTVQAHGLAIDYYASKGAEVAPLQQTSFQFLATKAGQFRVFCNIPCPIHNLIQHGLLIVT